jgi:hypothetical protein
MYVNLFTPSRVQWTEGSTKLALTQVTRYPFDNKIEMHVSSSEAHESTIYVRIPVWATPNPMVMVNGNRVADPWSREALRR